ncbi:MAG: type II toxin-antitoxin system prevent-host-death family antitoxin [Liquorilactobacillus nagelii]|uniref:type II toxin-antitoxin system prevent-host-death family antitoxin n=1 Tax=Liquorilactobacillus nagelii TaxID=82688 RepID=UPI0039EB5E20
MLLFVGVCYQVRIYAYNEAIQGGEKIEKIKARTNLFSLIKNANRDSTPVIIAGADESRSAVLIGKRDYDVLQETMKLIMNDQIQAVLSRKDEE